MVLKKKRKAGLRQHFEEVLEAFAVKVVRLIGAGGKPQNLLARLAMLSWRPSRRISELALTISGACLLGASMDRKNGVGLRRTGSSGNATAPQR